MNYLAEIAQTKLPFEPINLPLSKRIFDIIFSVLLCLIVSPFVVILIILSLLEQIFIPASRGPLLYSETRISKGKPFKIFKFRIFKSLSASDYFKTHGFIQTKALENDTRNLTYVGKILKQIYMDELPQLYNVLKGDMTLVGPRPSNEVVTWEDGQQGFFQRYLFTCGITGPFQMHKDSGIPLNQNQVDMQYIVFCKNSSSLTIVLTDLKILFLTIFTVLRARGI